MTDRSRDRPVELAQLQPVASGNNRLVYLHPHDPGRLIKVMRREVLEARKRPRHFYQRFKRERILGSFVREMREQLILRGHDEDFERFLQRIEGFCETDLGIGMVVRAVRRPDGSLAPSLKKVLAEGRFDEDSHRALAAFCDAILQSRIAVSGLYVRNILHGVDDEGRGRFILVDGFGEGALVRVKGAFAWINRRVKHRLIANLHSEIAGILASRPSRRTAPESYKSSGQRSHAPSVP